MRAHSHFKVDPTNPRARAVCDRCGQHWQLQDLLWQWEWTGPRLQNLRVFVCPPCLDKPQPNIKTFIYPPDPVPVLNPRVEFYVPDDNGTIQTSTGITGRSSLAQKSGGLSAIMVSANFFKPTFGNRIGTLTTGGGLNAAFDGNIEKQSWVSAADLQSNINSSYGSWVGINWTGGIGPNVQTPSSLQSPTITHSLNYVNIYAPQNQTFLDSTTTTYRIQGSNIGSTLYGAWTDIATGTTAGVAAESISVTISSTMNNPQYQFHRVAMLGNGTNPVYIAQVQFAVNETGATVVA